MAQQLFYPIPRKRESLARDGRQLFEDTALLLNQPRSMETAFRRSSYALGGRLRIETFSPTTLDELVSDPLILLDLRHTGPYYPALFHSQGLTAFVRFRE